MPQKNSSLESFSPLFLVHGKMKTRLISRYDFQISNYQLTKIIFRLNKINQNKNTSETKRLFIDLYKHELSGLYHRSYNEYSINNFSSSPNHTYFAIIKIKKFINDFNNLTKFSNAKKKYGSIPYPDLGQKDDNRKYFNVPIALYVVKDFNYYHFLYLREYLIEVESNLPVNKKPEPTKDKDQLQKAKKKETTVKIPYLPFYFSKLALRVISPYFILVLLLMLLYIHILIEQKLFNKFHIWDQEENKKTILNMKSQTWILGNLYFQQKDSKLIPFFIYSIGYGLIIYAFATNFYNEYFYFTTSLLWDFSIYQFINFVSLGVIPSVSILLITWKTGKSIIAIRNELKKSPHYLS